MQEQVEILQVHHLSKCGVLTKMAWGKAGSTTLSSAGDLITVDSLSNNKCIMILNHVFSSGQGKLEPKLNNDGTVNYTVRYELDGAAEVILNSSTDFENTTGGFTNGSTFHVQYLVNIATDEKLLISHSCEIETTGTSGIPRLREYVGKWRNTSDAVSRYDVPNVGTGDFASGSNSTLIGSEITPAAAVPAIDNVQDNSLFVDKVNARRYWFDANPLLDDDFSTDDWTDSGANVGISSGVMNFDIDRTTTDQSSYYQLSRALSDTKWTMRLHDVIVTTKSGGVEVFIGVSSNTSGAQTAQDFIGLNLGDNTANPVLGGVDSDGAVIARLAGDYTYSLSTTYNIEIIRESATSYRIKVFSNSGFDSTALFSQSYTCTATTTGLQYVKFANGQIAGSTENIIGTCSKVEIFDGVTTASGGGQWTMQPTFEDDFSSDKGWLSQDSGNSVTGGSLVFKGVVDNTNDAISYDLGTALSDTNWICRFKLNFTTLTSGSGYRTFFGISSASSATAQNGTHDFIGMSVRKQNNTLGSHDVDGGAIPDGAENTGGLTYATGTDYYFEIIRLSSTTYEIRRYSDSTYSTISQTVTGTCGSTVTGLQYFGIWNHIISAGDVHAGKLDDLKIYNGVSSIN